MEWVLSLNEVKIQKIQVCHVKIKKKKEKYIKKNKIKCSSTSLRIQFSHAEPSGTSKSNIPIVSFPKTHSIQASLVQWSLNRMRPPCNTQGKEIMKLLINNTEGTKVLKQLFSERHTAGKCRQIISSRSLTQQTLFIFVHKCKSYSQRTQQAAVTHGHWIMEMGFTDWNSTLFQFFLTFLKYVIFFPPHDTAFDPNKRAVTEAFRAFVLCSLCKISLRGSTTCSHWPYANWGESPKASWCHCTYKSLTNKREKNIMNIQTSSVKLIVLMKPSQINSKFYSHHILILIL